MNSRREATARRKIARRLEPASGDQPCFVRGFEVGAAEAK